MADINAQIEALYDELAKSTLTIESDGERVTKRSTDDILRQIAALERRRDAGGIGGRVNRGGSTVAVFERD